MIGRPMLCEQVGQAGRDIVAVELSGNDNSQTRPRELIDQRQRPRPFLDFELTASKILTKLLP